MGDKSHCAFNCFDYDMDVHVLALSMMCKDLHEIPATRSDESFHPSAFDHLSLAEEACNVLLCPVSTAMNPNDPVWKESITEAIKLLKPLAEPLLP